MVAVLSLQVSSAILSSAKLSWAFYVAAQPSSSVAAGHEVAESNAACEGQHWKVCMVVVVEGADD